MQTIRPPIKPFTIILIASSLIYAEFHIAFIYLQFFNTLPSKVDICFGIYFVIYTALFFFLMPALICKFILKEPLSAMGLQWPPFKKNNFVLIILALAMLAPYLIYCSTLTEFRDYSLGNVSKEKFILIIATVFPLHYFAEEFFFRGFLFFSLWKRVRWHSFWITDIIFTLAHLGKPGLEILLCIPASVIFNVLTLYTRSIYPAVFVHTVLGVILSYLTTFNHA